MKKIASGELVDDDGVLVVASARRLVERFAEAEFDYAYPGELLAGMKRVSDVGGAGVGDRTMIDALAPALATLDQGLDAAAAAARAGADSTAGIHKAKAGRAAYVPSDNLKGHNDPGAEAVALVFEGLARSLKG